MESDYLTARDDTVTERNYVAKLTAERDSLAQELGELKDKRDEAHKRTLSILGIEQPVDIYEKLQDMVAEAAWVRKKLNLPVDTQFLSGEKTLAGAMHIICAHAHGYETYIAAYRCDDKQGEIARLTVERDALAACVNELERESEK